MHLWLIQAQRTILMCPHVPYMVSIREQREPKAQRLLSPPKLLKSLRIFPQLPKPFGTLYALYINYLTPVFQIFQNTLQQKIKTGVNFFVSSIHAYSNLIHTFFHPLLLPRTGTRR